MVKKEYIVEWILAFESWLSKYYELHAFNDRLTSHVFKSDGHLQAQAGSLIGFSQDSEKSVPHLDIFGTGPVSPAKDYMVITSCWTESLK